MAKPITEKCKKSKESKVTIILKHNDGKEEVIERNFEYKKVEKK